MANIGSGASPVESDAAGPCSRDQGEHLQANECDNNVGRILRASA